MSPNQNLPFFIDKNWQYFPFVFSMNPVDLIRQFLSANNAGAPDTIISILIGKLRA
jgi:hypothetical protein